MVRGDMEDTDEKRVKFKVIRVIRVVDMGLGCMIRAMDLVRVMEECFRGRLGMVRKGLVGSLDYFYLCMKMEVMED